MSYLLKPLRSLLQWELVTPSLALQVEVGFAGSRFASPQGKDFSSAASLRLEDQVGQGQTRAWVTSLSEHLNPLSQELVTQETLQLLHTVFGLSAQLVNPLIERLESAGIATAELDLREEEIRPLWRGACERLVPPVVAGRDFDLGVEFSEAHGAWAEVYFR